MRSPALLHLLTSQEGIEDLHDLLELRRREFFTTYDTDGRVTAVIDSNNRTVSYAYDASGFAAFQSLVLIVLSRFLSIKKQLIPA